MILNLKEHRRSKGPTTAEVEEIIKDTALSLIGALIGMNPRRERAMWPFSRLKKCLEWLVSSGSMMIFRLASLHFGLGVETLENDEPLMDAGLDSLAAVEFANAISKDFVGLQMPGTLMCPGQSEYCTFLLLFYIHIT